MKQMKTERKQNNKERKVKMKDQRKKNNSKRKTK